MAAELVVRGGEVVDGTGAPARQADVLIRDGVIVEVADSVTADAGAVTVDASGCVVTPGFVDPHTHMDAQLCWDATASPSNLHGVTTIVIGLCGFGVAPCPPGGGDYLLRSLERVEEIPLQCTQGAVPFSWNGWDEYADYLAGRPLAVNVAGFVPHSALRWFAMGDRAWSEPATEADRATMVAELHRALAAGALGLATSRGPNHVDGLGNPVPSRLADDAELRDLVQACAGRVWQINVETKFAETADTLLAELDVYVGWTHDAGARLTWTPFVANRADGPAPADPVWAAVLRDNDRRNAGELTIAPQVAAQPIYGVLRLAGARPISDRHTRWKSALPHWHALDTDDRRALLAADATRAALRHGPGFEPDYAHWVWLTVPSDPSLEGSDVATLAARRSVHPADVVADVLLADDLQTEIIIPVANDDLDAVDVLAADARTLIGLGDSGAHVRTARNFTYPTHVLATLVRDRGVLSLEQAVERMTRQPARFLGLRDRGAIAPGNAGDVAVVDLDRLAMQPAQNVTDLPGGAQRIFQRATGYRAVVVNGQVTITDDTPTPARPGRLATP